MTIARYLSKFTKLLSSDGKVVNAGIVNNVITNDKLVNGTLDNFRNRIINGDMKISQRGTSFAHGAASGAIFTLDRYPMYNSTNSAVTITQQLDVPAGSGLSNSLRATVTTTDTSIVASEEYTIQHYIEGYNVADLVGVPFTISFWVRSSKTGIHYSAFRDSINSRSYAFEYVINSANTWEKKSITLQSGLDISSGTWNFTNGRGLNLIWVLAAGPDVQTTTSNAWVAGNKIAKSNQVNCLDTVGNIFAITGVQLEKGSVASEFKVRPNQVELAMCQRYYEIAGGTTTTANGTWFIRPFKVQKRVTPTITIISGSSGGATFDTGPDSSNSYRLPAGTNATSTADFKISASAEL